jgi:hypothetical protein
VKTEDKENEGGGGKKEEKNEIKTENKNEKLNGNKF